MEKRIFTLEETAAIAELLIAEAGQTRIFLFYGDMGAGKTTLIKSMCTYLGVEEATASPTFSIVNTYEGASTTIAHFDLFRINNASELEQIGFEEYLYAGHFVFIEWPELAVPYMASLPHCIIQLTKPDAAHRGISMVCNKAF